MRMRNSAVLTALQLRATCRHGPIQPITCLHTFCLPCLLYDRFHAGIISAGFLLHAALSRALQQHVQHSKTSQLQSTSSLMHLSKAACTVLGYSACGILASALVALPLLAHQQHAYSAFCSTSSSSPSSTKGLMNRVLMTAGSGLWQPSTLQAVQPSTQQAVQPRPWCGKGGVYNFVQQQYWGVGLLKYWQLSQVRM